MFQSLTGPATVVVDCANGVGAGTLQKISEVIGKKFLNVTVCNDGSDGILNDKVIFIIIISSLFTAMPHSVEQIM